MSLYTGERDNNKLIKIIKNNKNRVKIWHCTVSGGVGDGSNGRGGSEEELLERGSGDVTRVELMRIAACTAGIVGDFRVMWYSLVMTETRRYWDHSTCIIESDDTQSCIECSMDKTLPIRKVTCIRSTYIISLMVGNYMCGLLYWTPKEMANHTSLLLLFKFVFTLIFRHTE